MNFDKDVMLKIVALFERVNSKRMVSHFVLLLFLWACGGPNAMAFGVVTWLILVLTLIKHPGGDSLTKEGK